jgi:hypothetical protein
MYLHIVAVVIEVVVVVADVVLVVMLVVLVSVVLVATIEHRDIIQCINTFSYD